MNIVDHFTYGTYEVQKNAKETTSRVGFRYGHLALLRNDFFCNTCDVMHEAWSVANLVSGTYPFPSPMFNNVDDGCAYIYEIAPLAKWDTITVEQTAKLAASLVAICLRHHGIPIKVLALAEGLDMGPGQKPGTVAGLNGYTKQ